jgi:acyl-CoA synthetase (AMP-forming)/AMP-acid ligase II
MPFNMHTFFQADRLAAGLLQLGLKPGDRLGIWGPNSCGWYISKLAASRAGLIAVSNNQHVLKYRRCSEFSDILK